MNRTTSIALAAILVVATVAVPLAAASVVSSGSVQDTAEAGNESIKPGEQFTAAVGVQNAEIEGDISDRAFGVRIATAETNETKAAVVAAEVEASENRLAELENRLEALNESHEAGELSDGRYRAEVAKTTAEMRAIERRAVTAEATAVELPDGVLADRGVDVDSIRALRDRAGELGGPDTAAIARSIAGNDVGQSMGDGRGSPRSGPGGDESRTGGNSTSDGSETDE
jgi:hypothetical protein